MNVPYQDEAASLYRIAEYIERVMGVEPLQTVSRCDSGEAACLLYGASRASRLGLGLYLGPNA